MYSYRTFCLASISLLYFAVAAECSVMASNEFIERLGGQELSKRLDTNFSAVPGLTLHQMMCEGKAADDWIKAAQAVGILLTKFNWQIARSRSRDAAHLKSSCPLYAWLTTVVSSGDSVLDLLPARLRPAYASSVVDLKERATEAAKVLEKDECVCVQNVATKNIKVAPKILIDANSVQGTYGPGALDAAIFMADLLLMYYKQMGIVEHGDQFKTTVAAQEFGSALMKESSKQGVPEDDVKRFWKDVSLLAGWEVIRRYVTRTDVEEILSRQEHDPASIVECGLRLILNQRIDNPNFMVVVALAMLK